MAIDNIKIAEQLKKLQEDILSSLEAQTKTQKNQLEIAQELVKTASEFSSNSDQTVDRLQKTRESLEKAAEAAERLSSRNRVADFSKELEKASKKSGSLKDSLKTISKTMPAFGAFVGLWSGFAEGITASANALKLFGSFSMNALEALGQLAIGIISFPFKLLSNLINFASGMGGDNSLRQALEDIRKEFGDLSKASSAAIIGMARNMKGELANTGLSIYRTFGMLAERLKTIAEYAKNLGPLFAVLAGQFVKNAEVVGAYFKALGLTEEGQKAVATRALALGQDITEVSRQLANYSVQLADQFGLSAKEVSRDVGNMMADFEHFGGMAPQILTQISVYARRLGVEVKGLLGVIDQFDNFENAARSAAQLTQAFGLQVDALQMLKAQDPAERTEMLRKAFFAAGRSIENMTRQERALLQQQTGLEASTLDLVFSQKNQGLSYEQVKKKSEAARKSQLTQTEAMQKLAGAIERLVRSGSMGGGGFFERFFQGFERGIIMSRDFRRLMIDIRMALRATYWAGAQVGRMFVQMFPGVQQLLKGLDGLFNRDRFRAMLSDLKNIFRTFFTDLTSPNSKNSFKNFMDSLKNMFWNYFDGSSEAGRGILDGIRNFSKAVATILGGLLGEAIKGLTKGVRFITDVLSGRKSLSLSGGEGAIGFVADLFNPIIEAIKESGPPLLEALQDLWTEEIWPRLRNFLIDNAGYISAFLFGPALLNSLITGFTGAIGGAFTTSIVNAAKNLVTGTAQKAVSSAMSGLMESAINPQNIAGATEGMKAATQLDSVSKGFGLAEATALGLRLTAIAGALALGGVLLAGSIVAITHILKSADQEQIYNAFGVLASGVLGMVGVSFAVKALEAMQPQTALVSALAGIAAVVAISIAMAANFVLLSNMLSGVSLAQAGAVAIGIGAMSLVYLAGAGIFTLAAGIGATIAATGGAAILAGVAGFATISLVVQGMVEHGLSIMTQMNNFRASPGLEEKTRIFTSVIETLTGFASVFSDIISVGGPSIVDLIQNPFFAGDPSRRVNDTFGQIVEIIQVMGSAIQDITNMIVRHMRNVGQSAETIKGASAISEALEAVTHLAEAFRPPENFNRDAFGFFFPEAALLGIVNYMKAIMPLIQQMIPIAINMAMTISTLPTQFLDQEKINAFASMMEGIGSLLSILSPNSGMGGVIAGLSAVDQLNRTANSIPGASMIFGESETNNTVNFLKNLVAFSTNLLSGILSTGIFERVGAMINSLVGSASSMSPEQIKGLEAIGGILTGILGAVSSIIEHIQSLPEVLGSVSESGGNITQVLDFMKNAASNILVPMTVFLPPMIDALLSVFESKNLKAGLIDNVSKGMQAITTMFQFVSQIPSIVTSFQGAGTGDAGAISGVLASMQGIVSQIFTPGGPISSIMTAINDPSVFPTLRKGALGNIEQLKGSLTAISEIGQMQGLLNIADNLGNISTSISQVSRTHIGESIRTMVEEVNSIAHDLGAIEPININTSLKTLAGRLGLGSSEEITIRNRDFNIEVNLEVHVDARELENVLVDRPNTRIMHKARAR